MTEILQRFYT